MGNTIVFYFDKKYIIEKYDDTGFMFFGLGKIYYNKNHIFIDISQKFNNLQILSMKFIVHLMKILKMS